MGKSGLPLVALADRGASMHIRVAHGLQEGLSQASVASRRQAVTLIAAGADLDNSVASRALQHSGLELSGLRFLCEANRRAGRLRS